MIVENTVEPVLKVTCWPAESSKIDEPVARRRLRSHQGLDTASAATSIAVVRTASLRFMSSSFLRSDSGETSREVNVPTMIRRGFSDDPANGFSRWKLD